MGAIYLHSNLMDVTRGDTPRAYGHLIAILSRMSREGTWPQISLARALTADTRPRAFEQDQRTREAVVSELVNAGLLLDVDGSTIAIGPALDGLVRNTPPPEWEDGTLRAET